MDKLAENATAGAAATVSEQKHRAILDAATRVFLRLGYESAGMDLIAAEAGVSKQTIYNHFRNKEALFREIVADLVSVLMGSLAVDDAERSDPEHVLRALGSDLLHATLRPSSLALHRLIVAESARFPQFGRTVYAVGAGRVIATLADYLARETRRGRLSVGQPAMAAEQFLGMLSGRVQLRALLGVHQPSDDCALRQRVDYAVRSFLTLYAPAPGACRDTKVVPPE